MKKIITILILLSISLVSCSQMTFVGKYYHYKQYDSDYKMTDSVQIDEKVTIYVINKKISMSIVNYDKTITYFDFIVDSVIETGTRNGYDYFFAHLTANKSIPYLFLFTSSGDLHNFISLTREDNYVQLIIPEAALKPAKK